MSYNLRVKVGISKLNLLEHESFMWADALEIQISDYLALSKEKKKSLQRTISKNKIDVYWNLPASIFEEQIEIFDELNEEVSCKGVILNYLHTVDFDQILHKVNDYPEFPIFFDSYQKLSALQLKVSPRWILDPDFHFFSPEHKIYKLHGWHETRWVRRYGKEQLQKILKKCFQNKVETLFFAHSGRLEEGSFFKSLLTKL